MHRYTAMMRTCSPQYQQQRLQLALFRDPSDSAVLRLLDAHMQQPLSIVANPKPPSPSRRYHRILDLRSFRNMMADGTIPPEAFATIT